MKIIEADGQVIKKNQLDELQSEFSKKAFIGSKRIYIIELLLFISIIVFNLFFQNELLLNISIIALTVISYRLFGFYKDNEKKYGYKYIEIPPVKYGNEVISSTLIRNSLKAGNIKKANECLQNYVNYDIIS